MWTAIMIIALNGQPTEVRGAQSLDESSCIRAGYGWWLNYARQKDAKPVLDVRCVLSASPKPRS